MIGNSRLSTTLQTAIANEENELWLSPISIWETLPLAEKGRLTLEPTPEKWIQKSLQELDTKEATLNSRFSPIAIYINLYQQFCRLLPLSSSPLLLFPPSPSLLSLIMQHSLAVK